MAKMKKKKKQEEKQKKIRFAIYTDRNAFATNASTISKIKSRNRDCLLCRNEKNDQPKWSQVFRER